MDIGKSGKSGLIQHLTKDIRLSQPSTIRGIGDDAAVLRYGNATLVVASKMLVEGINFDLTYMPVQHLGYKAAIAVFSSLYAMNVPPKQLLVSIAVSAKFSVEALELFYQGLQFACERHHVDLVGGDTVSSVTGMAITTTATGEADPEKITCRNTAAKGDLICVSGNLGAACMGLHVLEREKKLFEEDPTIQPELGHYEYVVRRQLKPEARKDIIELLAAAELTPTSMIHLSCGLSPGLRGICSSSSVGCEIYHHKIPIADETVSAADEFYLDPMIVALNGGEDYELLFTVTTADYNKIAINNDISVIGYVTAQQDGCRLVTEGGTETPLQTPDWQS